MKITQDKGTSTLHIENVQPNDDEGYYTCKIRNPTGGSVETMPAQLTISKQNTGLFCGLLLVLTPEIT